MKIQDILQKNSIITNLEPTDKTALLSQMGKYLASLYDLRDQDLIVRKILDREAEMSTGIGFGIAIPHARIEGIDRVYMAAGRSVKGIDFNAIDEQPVHLVFMMLSPASASSQYTQLLSSLSRVMSYEEIRSSLVETDDPEKFLEVIIRGENKYVE
ncbi:MAG TPA: PTS sugar transporter subunit IIA [Chitinivibrionales bacterium]|nr:PTS sugar transporter subunit IIA [Chitinivibrionales bacterium]